MRTKVFAFRITPLMVVLDNEELVIGESEGKPFVMYPGNPFDIPTKLAELEQNLDVDNKWQKEDSKKLKFNAGFPTN